MTVQSIDAIVAEAGRLFELKHHCSEAIVIATGQYYFDPLPEVLIRASCPLGGGIAGCREELCGLVSGAALILGALWGRVSYEEDDKWLYEVVCEYRRRFIEANGITQCAPLRDGFAVNGGRCGPLVEDATRQLVALIEETVDARPELASSLARRARR